MSAHSALISKLPGCFDKAYASGDLLFFPSTVHKHSEHSTEFEIRLCPALEQKPKLPTPHFDSKDDGPILQFECDKPAKKYDPFAPPYNENLLIGELAGEDEDEEYALVLNKYSVVQHHFLLVTKKFQSQLSPLLPPDLLQTYLLLVAAKNVGRKFFAFYNCGDNSGASQPHKHIQFIPVDGDGPPIERLAREATVEQTDRPFALSQLPYSNHVVRLPANLSSSNPEKLQQTLSGAFLSVLDLVFSTVRHDPTYPVGSPSYNIFLTIEHMHAIPRRYETFALPDRQEQLPVNALGFAGMLLVKSEDELKAVMDTGVGKILRGVALESVHDIQIAGIAHEPESHL